MIRAGAALLAAAVVLASCGGGEDASRFEDEVRRIHQAVTAGDRDGALSGFGAVELLALDAHATGDLDDAELQELARLVEQGRDLVDQELPEPTTTTTTTSAPPPVAEDGGDEGWGREGKGEDKHGGEGKGRDRDEDRDDDWDDD